MMAGWAWQGGLPPADDDPLVLYRYEVRKRSSRQLEKATYDEMPFCCLAADAHPDHDTFAVFRQEHLSTLGWLVY